jgi:hypothetical protein
MTESRKLSLGAKRGVSKEWTLAQSRLWPSFETRAHYPFGLKPERTGIVRPTERYCPPSGTVRAGTSCWGTASELGRRTIWCAAGSRPQSGRPCARGGLMAVRRRDLAG